MAIPLLPKTKRLILPAKKQIAVTDLPTDWVEFVSLCQVKSGGSIVPFVPYDYQTLIIREIERSQNITICKSRQMGLSELICSYLLKRALTEPAFSAVIFSKTQSDSSKLAERIRFMAVSLGDRCPAFASDSKTELKWKGLGELIFLPVTARAARSIPSVSVAFFDEGAFIKDFEALYGAAAPTLAMLGDRGKIITCSTPNGKQGLYWQLLSSDGAESEEIIRKINRLRAGGEAIAIWQRGSQSKILLHYRTHPIYGRDPKWPEIMRHQLKLTMAQWKQEFELDFVESGALIFEEEAIARCASGFWSAPVPGITYLAGIDPSFGGGDNFVVQIWNASESPYSLAAEYRDSGRSKDYSLAEAQKLLANYQPAIAAIETNGGGNLILQELTKKLPYLKIEGVVTTQSAKLTNTDRLALLLERGALSYPEDSGFHQDAKHFVEKLSGKTRKREAETGFHDDSVMAAAIAFSQLDEIAGSNWLDNLVEIL